MPQSLTQLYIHLIFSTKYREPLIVPEIRAELYSYMGGILNNIDCTPIQIGGISDHIHILTCLSKKIPLMKMVEEVKRSSSKWVKTKSEALADFYWQNGYGAFTVGYTQIEAVRKYILNQEKHHAETDFKNEYRSFLNKYGVFYDEKYVWD
ncbi:MAG: IS200/IS605 family transposase [Chlorobiales bacterium]|nr:IS200/IS605 family transposase [Chlorobiales bacterium]